MQVQIVVSQYWKDSINSNCKDSKYPKKEKNWFNFINFEQFLIFFQLCLAKVNSYFMDRLQPNLILSYNFIIIIFLTSICAIGLNYLKGDYLNS